MREMKYDHDLQMDDRAQLINDTERSHMDRSVSEHDKAMEEMAREHRRQSSYDQQISSSRSLVMAALLLMMVLATYLIAFTLL